ncbi:glucosaminidase domain-containing protein [Marinomonas mediterranea]|uniref:glucosaminidase domain-containing protein n=1 Tax=Marinomonas mediterranea TaxID=119864 RepID=UPI00234A4461|nr:glucosaminidase domain-containing protein [Marinomonas mediterranea]WCN10458.1 flagellar biosynthesis protein FlgJ [Marinomonas mediterranea]WCN14506.1 flagellar biosynthesis protein FlgJ [Marinomonas mediterranea]
MERKILWIISFALIFVLWLKIDPSETQEPKTSGFSKSDTGVSDVASSKSTPEKKSTQKESKTSDALVSKNDSESKDSATEAKSTGDEESAPSPKETAKQDDSPLPGSSEDEKNYFETHPIDPNKPDFAAISDVKTRKETFFDYLTPFVREKNNLLLEDRSRLKAYLDNINTLSSDDSAWINKQRKLHRLTPTDKLEKHHIETLLIKLDIIPASLVLAQAANESAWGTSRFALMGNNYFGQWCFRKGCGLVPNSRADDAAHEVRKFIDARQSVFAYIDNLNSNAAYKELRAIRADLRSRSLNISGKALAAGLIRYSQRGQAYVDEIEGLIQYNRLWRFNREIDGYVSTALNN